MDITKNISLLSGGENEIIVDALGNKNIMVKIPKFRMSDVLTGGSNTVHPAFIINGVEKDFIYISKYRNNLNGGLPVSLPMNDTTFGRAGNDKRMSDMVSACLSKGKGWHLMTNAEWSAISLLSYKRNTVPLGANNGNGGDSTAPDRKGAPIVGGLTGGYVLPGSGPKEFSHNHKPTGIYDMNGNGVELVYGARIVAGEIQIIPNNDASKEGFTSTAWRAIMPDGTLVAPGTSGTIKYGSGGISTTASTVNGDFATLTNNLGVPVPEILQAHGLFPQASQINTSDRIINAASTGTLYTTRAGHPAVGAQTGVFYINFQAESFAWYRSCYIPE